MKIRELIAAKLGTDIPEGKWDAVFKRLDTEGKMTQRALYDLLVVILKYLEENEKNSLI